ncbi:MAG: hypothetical protein JXQ69_08975, partial [Paludibacteraceae bacterium]|nr:hypothetical protein [Paludibacteraceae bacterium]
YGLQKSTVMSSRPMNADAIRLDLKMEDFQLIGEETLNIDYRKYLGFSTYGLFTVIDSINGVAYERRNTKEVQFNTIIPGNSLLSKAMAPIAEKYPNADFITPVYSTKQSKLMFLGSKTNLSVKVKVYSFK